ncbi:MAG: hypothetical protein NKF70_14595 [Methanobacterium sp. ERen5]|nr:MAG: hypothetical protein NKF70_14595 [Methanobacterium sp. ERen5]
MEGNVQDAPPSNTLVVENKYLSEKLKPIENLPEKLEKPEIPYFKQKPVLLMVDGFGLFFKEIKETEYWICEQRKASSYLVQWIEIKDSKPQYFQRKLSNRNGLDVKNEKRDSSLIQTIQNRVELEKQEILDFLNEIRVFISENRMHLPPLDDDFIERTIDPSEKLMK